MLLLFSALQSNSINFFSLPLWRGVGVGVLAGISPLPYSSPSGRDETEFINHQQPTNLSSFLCKAMPEPANKSGIARAYDQWAETYDTDQNRTRELAGHVLREIDLPVSGSEIVEIGCGTGRNTEWLATLARTIRALDFSEEMLRRARGRVQDPRVRFIQHDVRMPWPVPDDSADLIIAMLVLEHVERLEFVFAEAARTLPPRGQLFISELHPMRQLMGGQAQFSNPQSGERELVPAFLHNVSDFVNGGLAAGLELQRLDEWRDPDAASNSIPRLLSLLFTKK